MNVSDIQNALNEAHCLRPVFTRALIVHGEWEIKQMISMAYAAYLSGSDTRNDGTNSVRTLGGSFLHILRQSPHKKFIFQKKKKGKYLPFAALVF